MKDISVELARAASQYRFKKPPDLLVSLQETVQKVLRFFNDLLSMLNIHSGLNDTSALATGMQFLLLLAGVGAALVIVYLAFTRMRDLARESRLATKGQELSERLLDSAGWRQEADRLAESGRFREGSRALYLSMLRRLDETEILEFMPTRSNYEYWYALAGRPALATNFKKMADLIDLIWFGNRIASQSDFCQCASFVESITEQIESIALARAAQAGTSLSADSGKAVER